LPAPEYAERAIAAQVAKPRRLRFEKCPFPQKLLRRTDEFGVRGFSSGPQHRRHLIPGVAVEEAARCAFPDANDYLVGPLRRRRGPFAPLPEEEGNTSRNALVAELADPVRVRRPRTGADLSAGDYPVERSPCGFVEGDGPASAIDRVMSPGKGVKETVANRHGVRPDPVNQGFEANPPHRGRHLEQIADPRNPILILDRNTRPEVGQWPWFEPDGADFRRTWARTFVFHP
jgi:hypothetical protein